MSAWTWNYGSSFKPTTSVKINDSAPCPRDLSIQRWTLRAHLRVRPLGLSSGTGDSQVTGGAPLSLRAPPVFMHACMHAYNMLTQKQRSDSTLTTRHADDLMTTAISDAGFPLQNTQQCYFNVALRDACHYCGPQVERAGDKMHSM